MFFSLINRTHIICDMQGKRQVYSILAVHYIFFAIDDRCSHFQYSVCYFLYYKNTGGDKLVISLRLSETDGELVKQCANRNGKTISSFVRDMLLDQIEMDYKETLQKVEVMKEK